jgi:hypothetical protein
MSIDFDYLAEVGEKLPYAGVRWGIGIDGQTLGIVAYALCNKGTVETLKDQPHVYQAVPEPIVFYAGVAEKMTVSAMVDLFDIIAQTIDRPGLTLVMEGALGDRETMVKQLNERHGVLLFKKSQGRYFDISEVIGSVADDQLTKRITLAPEFENRTERLMLDSEVGLIENGKKLSPIQAAHIWGLGYWSCVERRKKWSCGPGPQLW